MHLHKFAQVAVESENAAQPIGVNLTTPLRCPFRII